MHFATMFVKHKYNPIDLSFGHESVTSGIYKIEDKETGQKYIGQSKDIENRFRSHCYVSEIDLAIATKGEDNFDFSIIEELSEDKLNEREEYWIEYYNTYEDPFHYNSQKGGNCGSVHNLLCGGLVKYTLWDAYLCAYEKYDMYKRGRTPNPCRCFRVKFNTYRVPIGKFHDFVSCEIISRLIKEAVKDEIK